MGKNINIALVGNPNCGKTALFNALTGSKQRVANYPGVTIEKKHGFVVTPNNIHCTLIDLPGTYSLRSRSPDEKITRDIVLGQYADEATLDIILCVLDATNMQNGLRLVLELKETGTPIIVALNMKDIAKRRGYSYNIDKLQSELDCRVVETTAISGDGMAELLTKLDQMIPKLTQNHNTWQLPDLEKSRSYHKKSAVIFNQVKLSQGKPSVISDRIDSILLHPLLGIPILLIILFLLFQAVFSWSGYPGEILKIGVVWLHDWVKNLLPNTLLGGLLSDGVVSGLGASILFLPQIFIISLFIIFLEDSGYMARAAFLMDKLMSNSGLHGKAFIPLISSFACAIPGIMSTRTIENRNDRLITILVSPLVTCSARVGVYTLLISAFIPQKTMFGMFNLQGLVMFALYGAGIFFVLIMAFIFKFFFVRGVPQPSIMELPSYKIPGIKNLLIEVAKPVSTFLTRAGTIILAIMVLLWFLANFPHPPLDAKLPAIDYSFVGIIGHYIQYIFAPIGFNWQIASALIPGIAAREVVVSALGTIYAVSGDSDTVRNGLVFTLQHSWTIATGISLITWYVFAPQCISTLAVVKRETGSYKWPLIMFSYQIILAYVMAFIVYRICVFVC